MNAKEASTVKRIAGDIASGHDWYLVSPDREEKVAFIVDVAVAINDEVNRRVASSASSLPPETEKAERTCGICLRSFSRADFTNIAVHPCVRA